MDDLKLGVVIAQIINFGILFFLFKYFLGEKIVKAIEERRAHLQKFDNAEQQVREKEEEAKLKADSIINEARNKSAEITKNADEIAKQNIEKSKQKAEMEANSIISNAQSSMEKERLSMMGEMKSKVVDLSLRLNKKMFSKESANKDFMEKELESLK
ncbi:MAG: ATP synthase F0 subunit B [Patescibacteria group bacterium]